MAAYPPEPLRSGLYCFSMGVEQLALDGLLEQARDEPKQTRIGFRGQVAAFETEAVEPMRVGLADPALGAFAVRVLETIARCNRQNTTQ